MSSIDPRTDALIFTPSEHRQLREAAIALRMAMRQHAISSSEEAAQTLTKCEQAIDQLLFG